MDFKNEASRLLEKDKEENTKNKEDASQVKKDVSMNEAQEIKELKDNTPIGYIPIELSTEGKLSLPKVVHLRNFDTTEIVDLVSQIDENKLSSLVRMFGECCYEDVDFSQATDKELLEIALTIYKNFYSNVITDFSFPLDENDLEFLYEHNPELLEKIKKGKNRPTVDIPISSIDINRLPKDFKEPITIKDKGTNESYSFKIPRIADGLIVQEYIRVKYEDEDERMYKIEQKLLEERQLKIDAKLSGKERKAFKEYEKSRAVDHVKAIQKLCLVKLNGVELTDLDSKLDTHIPQGVWTAYTQFLENLKMGVQDDVKVLSPITNKEETRRFEFRSYDIMEAISVFRDDTKFDIQYG